MQTQIRLAPEALNWAAGVGPRTKVAAVRIPLMHQSSSLAPIPSYPEEQLLNDKRRKNLRVMSISITVRDLKKKKKEETDPPPYFRESRVTIPPSSPSYSAVAAEMLPRGVGFSGTHKTAAPERQNVLDLPLLSLQVHRSIIKTY